MSKAQIKKHEAQVKYDYYRQRQAEYTRTRVSGALIFANEILRTNASADIRHWQREYDRARQLKSQTGNKWGI